MSNNALALLEEKNAAQYFVARGLDPIIEKIREEVTTIVTDISTKKGRDEVASLAYKVAKSKTAINELGKKLVSGIKEQAKAIDAERSRAWDAIEAIQKEVRKPLTEWEEQEKARIARHEADIGEIVSGGRFTLENWQTLPLNAMADRLKEIEALTTWTWQEFAARAKQAIDEASASIRMAIQKRQAWDAERAELERLRLEDAERRQREHEEKLKADAAAKAKSDAEAQAKQVAEALAAKVKADAEKAERERLAIERERVAAEQRAAKAEADRIAAEQKAIAAAEKAKRDAESAVQRERERAEAARKAEADAAAKREANKRHRANINGEALAGLMAAGIAEEIGRMVIGAIAKGNVPHVAISY